MDREATGSGGTAAPGDDDAKSGATNGSVAALYFASWDAARIEAWGKVQKLHK